MFIIRHNIFYFFGLFLISIQLVQGQNTQAKDTTYKLRGNYVWPVKGSNALTGTFGEYRSTHFHMGMDFSTGGRRGLPVVSVSKGKIVQVQRYWNSIGNAVIVLNDDGFYTRYGHLSKFSKKLNMYLKNSSAAKLYKNRKDFMHNLTTPILVEAGELIALSGDTGIGPPHLHLELYKDGIYYNPKDFGLGHEEGEEVVLDYILIKPETSRTFINGKNIELTIPLIKTDGGYATDPIYGDIHVQGIVSIQVSGYQKSKASRLGLQSLSLVVNQKKMMDVSFQSLPKAETKKFVLVYDSYKSKSNGQPFLYNLFSRDGGNQSLGRIMIGSGLISSGSLDKDNPTNVTILAGGLGNNQSEAALVMRRDNADYSHIKTVEIVYNVKYNQYTNLSSSDHKIELFFPTNAVYSRGHFQIDEITDSNFQFPGLQLESKVFKISPENFREFNLGYDIYVKLGHKSDMSKAGLYEIKPDGKAIPVKKANYSMWGRFFKARLKKTGTFAILSDFTIPTIELLGGYKNGHIFKNSDFEIEWKIKDLGSGFDQNSIQIKIDGELGVAEVNPHTGSAIVVEPEKVFEPGKHKMEAMAFDRSGNASELIVFEYQVAGGRIAQLNPQEEKNLTASRNIPLKQEKTKKQ
jgi:hypothetical protein